LASGAPKVSASGCGPHVTTAAKKHRTVVPATGADNKEVQEDRAKNDSPTPLGLASLSAPSQESVAAARAGSTGEASASITTTPSTNTEAKKAAEPKKITLKALISRETSVFNLLPNSLNKKIQGADVVVLGALAGLKKSEEILACEDSDTQAQLSSAVHAIITSGNLANAEEFLKLCDNNGIFIDKTQRRSLRTFIANLQQKDDAAFQEEYNRECTVLQEKLKKHIERSKKYDGLIDGTYKLGGTGNLTEQELAFLQGNKSKLTKEQQEMLARKRAERVKAGLSDNEEEHPEFVDPKTIIKIPAASLSTLKPGEKSLKALTATAAAKK
jgi:hypothetical protein